MTQFFYKLFATGTEAGKSMGGCYFTKILPINVPKSYTGIIQVFDKKFSFSSNFYYLEIGFYLSITDIVGAMDTLIQERHNHGEDCLSVEVSRRTQNLRLTLQMKDLALNYFVRNWDTFSKVMIVMKLQSCWKKDLTNQILFTKWSAFTIWWYTRTWSNTISLVTRRPACCVVFHLIQSSRQETIKRLDSIWAVRPSVIYSSDSCSKKLVLSLTWKTWAVKKSLH